jgi:hypothetical protein
MKSKTFVVSLVAAVFAIAMFFVASVYANGASTFGDITNIEVNGIDAIDDGKPVAVNIASFAGQTLPVEITFVASKDVSDVRVKAWISGEREYAVSSNRFKVFNGSTYDWIVSVPVPFDIDPREDLRLKVSVEGKGDSVQKEVPLAAQRESYLVEILDVVADTEVKAGEVLALDIVLKNRGLEFSEDTFVRVKIASLGVEERAYFGDLAPVDQGGDDEPEKEDAAERRLFLRIPSSAKPGTYVVELEAYNDDSSTILTKKVNVVGVGLDSRVVSAVKEKSFAVGEKGSYSLTLVNMGNKVSVYELVAEAADKNLDVSVEEPIVVVPAGSSRTVKVETSASKAGEYAFTVNVYSDGELVAKESFTANIEGARAAPLVAGGVNTTVLLTVVLAIIFVVLLVVLIVLLTRKPEKEKEFGESYY